MSKKTVRQVPIRDCANLSLEDQERYGCPVIRDRAPGVFSWLSPTPTKTKRVTKTTVALPAISASIPEGHLTIPKEPRYTLRRTGISLDLDETLVFTSDPDKGYPLPENARKSRDYYSFDLDGRLVEGIKRPRLDEFIKIIFQIAYPVVVFTAGHELYAAEICKIIFPSEKPTKVYSYSDCHVNSDSGRSGKLKKPIRKMNVDFPDLAMNTKFIVVDDRKSVYYDVDHSSVFKIPKWEGNDPKDNHLMGVIDTLKRMRTTGTGLYNEKDYRDVVSTDFYD